MKFYDITEAPIKIYGLAVADKEKQEFWKLPLEALEQFPRYEYLGRRAAGGRVRFMTDSSVIQVNMTLKQTKEDIYIPLSGSGGVDFYEGIGEKSRYLGSIAPVVHSMEKVQVEKSITRRGEMDVITINLPRNDHLLSMSIGIPEDAKILPAPEYTYSAPIVFYGSSITEGGCAPRPGNAYTSIVCRQLDTDYRNMGFSGSAKGEIEFARFLCTFSDMSMLVMDYDHNAPDVEHLKRTHEPFFKEIRNQYPNLPVIFISRPDVDKDIADSERRREVIRTTYENAKTAGDELVWFIDGFTLFGENGREECTIDGTHPNTLGFMRMAEKIYPVIKSILSK